VLAVETVLDEFVVGVNVIENSVSIHLVACRKNDDLEMLFGFLEALHDVGPDVDACVHSLFVGKIYLKNHVWVLRFYVVDTVDQSFIHVKNHKFFVLNRIKGIIIYLRVLPSLGSGN